MGFSKNGVHFPSSKIAISLGVHRVRPSCDLNAAKLWSCGMNRCRAADDGIDGDVRSNNAIAQKNYTRSFVWGVLKVRGEQDQLGLIWFDGSVSAIVPYMLTRVLSCKSGEYHVRSRVFLHCKHNLIRTQCKRYISSSHCSSPPFFLGVNLEHYIQ